MAVFLIELNSRTLSSRAQHKIEGNYIPWNMQQAMLTINYNLLLHTSLK